MCTLIQALIDADMCPMTQFGDILMCDLDFVNFRILSFIPVLCICA